MKLNIVNVLNEIEVENESQRLLNVEYGLDECNTHQHEDYLDHLDWSEEYELNCWKRAREEKRIAIEHWQHIVGIDDYYSDWLQEKQTAEYWNNIACKECDRLMWEGKDYSHIHFDKVLTFDEWMENEMEIISRYMVVVAA